MRNDYVLFVVEQGDCTDSVLWERHTKYVTRNKEYDSYNAILPPSFVMNDKFVSYLSDYDLYEMYVTDGFSRADEQTEKILKEGGACLLVYSMKSL